MNGPKEYENFSGVMKKLLRVPHSEVKAKLDAEKRTRKKKRKPKKREYSREVDA